MFENVFHKFLPIPLTYFGIRKTPFFHIIFKRIIEKFQGKQRSMEKSKNVIYDKFQYVTYYEQNLIRVMFTIFALHFLHLYLYTYKIVFYYVTHFLRFVLLRFPRNCIKSYSPKYLQFYNHLRIILYCLL